MSRQLQDKLYMINETGMFHKGTDLGFACPEFDNYANLKPEDLKKGSPAGFKRKLYG